MTGRCGECRHWDTSIEKLADEWGTCGGVIFDETYQTNRRPHRRGADDDPAATLARKAVVIDGSGYSAALRSRSDFGCVLFAPRGDQASAGGG